MSDVGYDSYNLLLNLGTMAVLVMLYFAKVVFMLFVLKPLSLISPKFIKTYNLFWKQVFFGDFFLLFIEGFMEFLISSSLLEQTPVEIFDSPVQRGAALACLIITCVIIPIIYVWLFTNSVERFK